MSFAIIIPLFFIYLVPMVMPQIYTFSSSITMKHKQKQTSNICIHISLASEMKGEWKCWKAVCEKNMHTLFMVAYLLAMRIFWDCTHVALPVSASRPMTASAWSGTAWTWTLTRNGSASKSAGRLSRTSIIVEDLTSLYSEIFLDFQ